MRAGAALLVSAVVLASAVLPVGDWASAGPASAEAGQTDAPGSAASVDAVPPPPGQVTAQCSAPSYASDMLVCADPELRELDLALRRTIVDGHGTDSSVDESHEDWFRRSRMCAFERDQRACLLQAYCARLRLLSCSSIDIPAACAAHGDDHVAAAAISRVGFARPGSDVASRTGEVVRLWGFVDYQNLYGGAAARDILGEWWSGTGPGADSWRFDLKAAAEDGPGESFAVHVPDDCGRDRVLSAFRAAAEAGRPTRVYLEGRLYTFAAPAGARQLTGLRLQLEGANAIDLAPAETD